MSFDIYGQRLKPGNCEVHPEVYGQYPCHVCTMEDERERSDAQEYDAFVAQEEDEYWRSQFIDEVLSHGTPAEGTAPLWPDR